MHCLYPSRAVEAESILSKEKHGKWPQSKNKQGVVSYGQSGTANNSGGVLGSGELLLIQKRECIWKIGV